MPHNLFKSLFCNTSYKYYYFLKLINFIQSQVGHAELIVLFLLCVCVCVIVNMTM